ncbi:MAG TPA: hypothetical protein PKD68_05165, partial [Candidatus Saccharibacteria bacterium]|nr:hypothetical protein [Candidatus Saccharibacteria bacterium]
GHKALQASALPTELKSRDISRYISYFMPRSRYGRASVLRLFSGAAITAGAKSHAKNMCYFT